jgi:dihydroflavonol-4-reductase
MPLREVFDIAADAEGARRPRFSIPSRLLYIIGFARDIASRLLRRDIPINSGSVKLMHIMPPMDHTKAVRELGWHPAQRPTRYRRRPISTMSNESRDTSNVSAKARSDVVDHVPAIRPRRLASRPLST